MNQPSTQQSTTIWQDQIDSWLASGTSIAKWCKKHQVVYHQFIYQKNKLGGKKRKRSRVNTSQFIELTDTASADSGITIEWGDVRICLTSNFDEAALLRCVQVVRRTV